MHLHDLALREYLLGSRFVSNRTPQSLYITDIVIVLPLELHAPSEPNPSFPAAVSRLLSSLHAPLQAVFCSTHHFHNSLVLVVNGESAI